jgi:hypothetical protein
MRQTLGVLIGLNSTARPLGGRTGITPGTPDNILSVTSTTWTVTPFGGVLDLESSTIAGPYTFAFDANTTGSVTAANATNQRVDSLFIQLSDPAEGDGTATPGVAINYVAGTAGAAGGARGAAGGPPAVPARSMELAQITVPASGGGSPTIVMVAPYTATSGSIIPARNSSEYPSAPFDGQFVYDRTLNQTLVYDGSLWTARLAGDTGWITTGVATAASGGTITGQLARKEGNRIQLYLSGTMPSASGGGSTNGDFGNLTICTLTAAWQPAHSTGAGSANTGANFSYYIGSDGTVSVTSGPPAGFATGDPYSLQAFYFND